jgi:hypothetical protein
MTDAEIKGRSMESTHRLEYTNLFDRDEHIVTNRKPIVVKSRVNHALCLDLVPRVRTAR